MAINDNTGVTQSSDSLASFCPNSYCPLGVTWYEIACHSKKTFFKEQDYEKNWDKVLQIALLFVGTYGERCFMLLHTLISSMNPTVFSFICLTVIFIGSVELISKQ